MLIVDEMKNEELKRRIQVAKAERNVLVLAHYYQDPEIQDVADFIGDSLALAQQAVYAAHQEILLCGVTFMAETVKILAPHKTVRIPDKEAGCSLSDSCPPDLFRDFVAAHPNHQVVTYINSSAEVKAMSHYICTSSNAEQIIQSIPAHLPILFAPDENLGNYLKQTTGRDMVLWPGHCAVHRAISLERVADLFMQHPHAVLLVHPECDPALVSQAHVVGSTKKLLEFASFSTHKEFIVATEVGILYQMRKLNPNKRFYAAPTAGDTACACSECAFMKRNTLEKVAIAAEGFGMEIFLNEDLRAKAELPLKRMMALSK